MVKLILKFQDVCYFVDEKSSGTVEKITVLLPDARAPLPVHDPQRPELKSLLPHYPYIRLRPLQGGASPVHGVGDLKEIEGFLYWFYPDNHEFRLGATQQPLSLSSDFEDYVISMESLFGPTDDAKVDPNFLGSQANSKLLHSRFVVTNGRLVRVEKCQWGSYGDATYRFRTDNNDSPAQEPPAQLASRVVFEIDIEEGGPLLTARTIDQGLDRYAIYPNPQHLSCVELTVGNSPLEALAGIPSDLHSLRDFFIYYRLLKRGNPGRQFFPEQIDPQTNDVVWETSTCCQCTKSTHP